jgi:hypothetical protein
MSRQLDLSKPLDQETIDDLLTRHPVEKVQYWVQLASGSEFEESDEENRPEGLDVGQDKGYDKFTNDQLKDRLVARGLSPEGSKKDLVQRLEDSDERPQGSPGV